MPVASHPLAHEIPYWNQLTLGRIRGELRTMGLENAYDHHGGVIGVFLDDEDEPSWAREIARYDLRQFRAETPHRAKRFGDVEPHLASGEGEFHVNSADAARLWSEDENSEEDIPFRRAQNYGSCVDASLAEGITGMLGWRAARPEYREKWLSPAGWYEGANRGYTADGQSLAQAALIYSQIGYALMVEYRGDGSQVADLNGDDNNEWLVWRKWTKDGGIPEWMEEITAERHPFHDGAITEFEGGLRELRKVLAAGGFLQTGGTYTSGGPGDPISPVGRVGSHAQVCCGYDDSDQFRAWYKDRGGKLRNGDFPIVMHQTWGDRWSGWCPPENWPEWWGIRPSGAWCWWASDLLRYLGAGSFAYLPYLKGVPDEIPVPPPPPPPPPPPVGYPTVTGTIRVTLEGHSWDYDVVRKETTVKDAGQEAAPSKKRSRQRGPKVVISE